MIVYADTSALFKLIHDEAESVSLRDWLVEARADLLTCSIGVVELIRAAARSGEPMLAAARELADHVSVVQLTGRVLEVAAVLPPAPVRTLDALHVASALMVEDLDVIVAYDHRLLEAASRAGLATVSPGS